MISTSDELPSQMIKGEKERQSGEPTTISHARHIQTYSTSFAVLLDLIRFYSACCVVVAHGKFGWFDISLPPIFLRGHDAVIVFFVLSGLVISLSQSRTQRSFSAFIKSRLVRLAATSLPGLAITAVVTVFLTWYSPEFIQTIVRPAEIIRFAASALFVQCFWFRGLTPSLNGPYWSLSYEFVYYVLFATTLLTHRPVVKYLAAVAIAIIAGPGIILLFPAWLVGVIANRAPVPKNRLRIFSALSFAVGLTIVGVLIHSGWRAPMQDGVPPLGYSSSFISDWGFAAAVALLLHSAKSTLKFDVSNRTLQTFRALGDLTFPIYVFHFPILALFACFSGARSLYSGPPANGRFFIAALITTVLLGIVAERYRPLASSMLRVAAGSVSHFYFKTPASSQVD